VKTAHCVLYIYIYIYIYTSGYLINGAEVQAGQFFDHIILII